jgi:hypothetical protein
MSKYKLRRLGNLRRNMTFKKIWNRRTEIINRKDGYLLGYLTRVGNTFVFDPEPDMRFYKSCLYEIINEIKKLNEEYK